MNRVRIWQIGLAVGVAGLVLGLVLIGLLVSEQKRGARNLNREDVLADFRGLGRDMDPAAAWVGRSEAKLESLSRDNAVLRREMKRMQEGLLQAELRFSEAPVIPLPEPALQAPPPVATPWLPVAPMPSVPLPVQTPMPTLPMSPEVGAAIFPKADAGVLVVDLTTSATTAAPHAVDTYLPAGSFARAALLTGLDAPTGGVGQSNPVPVLLSLVDGGQLPNRVRHHVQECFVTAAGYGDLAAERAYLRLERLSCVTRAGRVLDVELHGYVVGEDGKAGLRGRLVSKQGAMIARALLAGLAGGISEGLSQSMTTLSTSALGAVQSVDSGQIAQYGVARGAGSALDRLAQWYLDRADEVYPIIEIGSGRKVEVVLTRGLNLDVAE